MFFPLISFFLLFLVINPAISFSFNSPVRIFVSIPPLAWFVERLSGSLNQIEIMIPSGASPHTFEPTPRQIASLAQAHVYFSLGLPFEQKILLRVREANPFLKIINSAEGVECRRLNPEEEEFEFCQHNFLSSQKSKYCVKNIGEPDPHFWLSPAQACIIATNLAQALKEINPSQLAIYNDNLCQLLEEIYVLDHRLAQVLAPLQGNEFLVYHPAFGYLGTAYGLKQIPVEIDGKEPGSKRLARLIKMARARGIRVVFVQPQYPVFSAMRMAGAIDGVVIPLDPLNREWARNLEYVANQLEQTLRLEIGKCN